MRLPPEIQKLKNGADRAQLQATHQSELVSKLRAESVKYRSELATQFGLQRERSLAKAIRLEEKLRLAEEKETMLWDKTRTHAVPVIRFELDDLLSRLPGAFRDEAEHWLLPRLITSTTIMFRKLQDGGLSSLNAQKQAGQLQGFALAYLAQDDSRLSNMPADAVPRERVIRYPTNFSAMKAADHEFLVQRGYQLMKAVLHEHVPELVTK